MYSRLLNWLTERGTTLEQLTQAHLDRWQAGGPSTREIASRFLGGAITARLVSPDLRMTPHRRGTSTKLPAAEQDRALQAVVTQHAREDLSPQDRLAVILVLVFQRDSRGSSCTSSCTSERVTICSMGTLTIRTDSEVERALESLTGTGLSRSEAARSAILEAERAQRRARLRAEAEDLRSDPDDVALSRGLADEMDAIRAW